jgi:MFS-type transporter involved in bile tolerance (Atg22 family)
MEQYQDITLCANIMFVNTIPFLLTITRDLKFRTAEALVQSRSAKNIMATLKNVNCIYAHRGFRILTVQMDGE